MKTPSRLYLLPALAMAGALAACGGSSSSNDTPEPPPAPPPAGPAAGSLSVVADKLVPATQAQDLRGVAYAKDGKIYVSGHVGLATAASDRQTVVGRFNADGTPDTSFGTAGFATFNLSVKDPANPTINSGDEQSSGIVELANGDVVVAVTLYDGNGGAPVTTDAPPTPIARNEGTSVALLRLTSTGQRVTTFGTNGLAVVDFGWTEADNASYPEPVYNADKTALVGNGAPRDSHWNIVVDPSTSGSSERIVVFGAGPAKVGALNGGVQRVDSDRYVARILASNGTPDPTFNGGSAFSFNVQGGTLGDQTRNGIVESDGKIVGAGYANLGTGLGNHVVLFRLTSSGALDTSFTGFGGTPVQPGVAVLNPFVVDGGVAEAYGVARQSDGSYVTTGYGGATQVREPARPSTLGYQSTVLPDLVSFRVKNGAVDTTYGNNGTQAFQSEGKARPTTEDRGRDVVALADDRLVHVGRYGGNAAVFVTTKDGKLDTRADTGITEGTGATANDGIIELPNATVAAQFFSAAVSADGKRVVATTNADDNGARLLVLEVN